MRVKNTPYVVGCNVGGTIYLNPDLKKYPDLRRAIIKHELEHSNGYTTKDFFIDLKNTHLKGLKKDYYSFIIKHPKSLVGLLPIMRLEKKWVFDVNLTIIYLLSLLFVLSLVLWVVLS